MDEEKKKCVLCDRIWGLFGIALGIVFLYISFDVLTDGRITTALSRRKEADNG